ncbi:MAG: DegT/DnrJ/EryC1/StrS family aminotransferase [Rubrivivax sp.]
MPTDTVPLSLPPIGEAEQQWVAAALDAPSLAAGAFVERLEQAFAERHGRAHGVAVASATLGLLVVLRALGIGAGHEVVMAPLSWHEAAHAVLLAGAEPVLADIDYWTGCLDASRAAPRIGPATRALLAVNVNGHPAAWGPLRALARQHGLALIEDSSESIGSTYAGRPVGSFGDVSVFDFSAPGVIDAGGGALLLTDDAALAHELRALRARRLDDRRSVSAGARLPLQAGMGELGAALALAQLTQMDERLGRRAEVVAWYERELQGFEGIKPPYRGSDVGVLHPMLAVVHLGTRFGASARRQMVDDLAACGIEAAPYCLPLQRQFAYAQRGARTLPEAAAGKAALPLADRIGDRMLALPLHPALTEGEVRFIVASLKDAATNVGAGAAIYL